MPDNETTEQPETVTLVLTDEQKAAIQGAKAPGWKKVLYWTLGIIGLLLIIVIVIAVVVGSRGKKKPAEVAKDVVDFRKNQIEKADMDAKITAAKAAGAEKAVTDELERIKEIDDEYERSKRLAEIL